MFEAIKDSIGRKNKYLTITVVNMIQALSCLLMTTSRNFTPKRGLRGFTKIFRTKLPKYKVKLLELPPLTELLASSEEFIGKNALGDLRQKKLNVYKSYLPVKSNTNLLDALHREDNDLNDILNIIGDNLNSMSSFYIAVSFEAIDDTLRAREGASDTVIVAPEFKRLCVRALYKMRFFESDEILKLIKCLSTLRFHENTLIVQAALEMARHLINDFNIKELDALNSALAQIKIKNSEESSLLMATRAAIPLAKRKLLEAKQFPLDYELLQTSSDTNGDRC